MPSIMGLRHSGPLALAALLLWPVSVTAGAGGGLTVRDYLALSQAQQEQYVEAFVWGAAFVLAQVDEGVEGCAAADKLPAQVVGELRAWAIVEAPQRGAESVNQILGEQLFAGCPFAGGTD